MTPDALLVYVVMLVSFAASALAVIGRRERITPASLAHCGRCAYSREGIGDNQVCPECGEVAPALDLGNGPRFQDADIVDFWILLIAQILYILLSSPVAWGSMSYWLDGYSWTTSMTAADLRLSTRTRGLIGGSAGFWLSYLQFIALCFPQRSVRMSLAAILWLTAMYVSATHWATIDR